MLMCDLLKYSDNCSITTTTANFWNYYEDEMNDAANENDACNNKINNNKTITSKTSGYRTK